MRLTTMQQCRKLSARPFADNIYHFRRLSKKFPRLPSPISKKQVKSEEIPKKMRTFVGAFGCIDGLKTELQSLPPQEIGKAASH